MPKCTHCKKNIDKATAYIIETTSERTGKITKKYYCSEEEYNKIIKDRSDKDNVYKVILKYFPSIKMVKDLPKVFFIEMGGIAETHDWGFILNYLHDDEEYLKSVMDKEFVSCNAKANYLYKVILNRIDGSRVQVKAPIVKITEDVYIPPSCRPNKQVETRRGFDDLLEDL